MGCATLSALVAVSGAGRLSMALAAPGVAATLASGAAPGVAGHVLCGGGGACTLGRAAVVLRGIHTSDLASMGCPFRDFLWVARALARERHKLLLRLCVWSSG